MTFVFFSSLYACIIYRPYEFQYAASFHDDFLPYDMDLLVEE